MTVGTPTTPETTLDVPAAGAVCRVDIGWVFIRPGHGVERQRVRVTMAGAEIGEATLTGPCAIEFCAPQAGSATLAFPDARSPRALGINADPRLLGIGVAGVTTWPGRAAFPGVRVVPRDIERMVARTGLPPATLAARFTSLGMQCEFGLVQRELGAEPLGLLRFSNTPLDALLRLLEGRCRGLGAPGTLEATLFGDAQEFVVKDGVYGVAYHTWQYATAIPAQALLAQEQRRLPFLARHFVETLEDGEAILVFRDPSGAATPEDERRLLHALRRFGPNRLLVVHPAPEGRAGTVAEMGGGLWHGFIGYGGPEYWLIATHWTPMLARAFRAMNPAAPGVLGTAGALAIDLTTAGNGALFLGTGWGEPEATGTWMLGPESALHLERPGQPGDHRLALVAEGFGMQPVTVRLNGTAVAHWHVAGRAEQACVIPWAAFGDREHSVLSFDHPQATSPRDVGLSADPRPLALFTVSVRLAPTGPGADA